MNELLEKARQMYPKGTKFKDVFGGEENVITKNIFAHYNNIYTANDNFSFITIYNLDKNQWAEIIKEETMTQQEFNNLKVGDFLNIYEILHKYKEFLIVRCEDGHDLFDLNKINKLGLKVKPNLFMGLEIKKYDYVPCEINGKELYYLCEAFGTKVSISNSKYDSKFYYVPTSIRIL